MKNEIPIFDPIDKYIHWLISKFTLIIKRTRLISKQLAKMIISNGMISKKKDLFTEILYNREAVLTSDFTEIKKVKK